MTYYLSSSLYVFVSSVIFGALIGVWYSTFVLLRILKKLPTPLLVLYDILFAISSFALIFMFTYSMNEGVFRIYEAVGLALGFFIYYFTLGRAVLFIFLKLIALARKILKILYQNTLVKLYILLDKFKKKGKIIIERIFKDNYQKKLYKNFLKTI